MGSFSLMHWLVVLVLILVLFGSGKLPTAMADLAKGLTAFRKGLRDPGDAPGIADAPAVTEGRK